MPEKIQKNLSAGNKTSQPEQANPEQNDYNIFVSQGILQAGPAADKIKGRASVDVIGNILFDIILKIEDEGKKSGVEFSLPVVLNGASEILNHLIEMSDVQVNEEQIKTIIGTAVGRYVQDAMKTGKWTPEQAQEMAQQAEGLTGPGQGQGGPNTSPPGAGGPGLGGAL